MADHTTAVEAASVPSASDIARAEAFAREPFLFEGESAESALAPGAPRRLALDYALGELDGKLQVPSTRWRRAWSLMLGLERVLSEDEPHLADGTTLNPHQVDALSGTLTALLADRLRAHEEGDAEDVAAPVLAVEEEPAEVPPSDDEEVAAELAALDEEHEEDEDDDAVEAAAEAEPADEEEPTDETDEDIDAAVLNDPNAHKRFWFEHATGAGKTVAAMGFVEASRTGGVLILTHRRNLVDQFNDELRTRGYADRVHPPLLGDDTGPADGPVTVETYQWFVRNAGQISSAYTIVICDEAHTA
ncbi:MAG TPA: DEAD/DEAH box helicase family protein, partial [Solirubrobacteraceae bacterium]|nr:DEAD/DEAH box helicase family protein [Solirubrobacteraceae bacterium]